MMIVRARLEDTIDRNVRALLQRIINEINNLTDPQNNDRVT